MEGFPGRYRDIIPDYQVFLESLEAPFPSHLRVNRLRTSADALMARMASYGAAFKASPICREAFEIDGLHNPGATKEFFMGHYHLQALSSMLPPMVLDPAPGTRVLDLCAAPGSKAGQIAAMMNNEGLLVVNDPLISRLKLLKFHLERLGVINSVITRYQGQVFPERFAEPVDDPGKVHEEQYTRGRAHVRKKRDILFDSILVDAPCSGEGILRAPGVAAPRRPGAGRFIESDPRGRDKRSSLQKQLLEKASKLLKPGGSLVYSTCTYAPEENEAVVDHVITTSGLRVAATGIDGPFEPGITCWGGRKFHESLARTVRIYPHRLNSVGFFIARLKKEAP